MNALIVVIALVAPLVAVGAVSLAFGFRDQWKIKERESRCKAAGKEFYWAEGGGIFAMAQCNCSQCGGWTPLHGSCRCCGVKNP